MWRRDGREIGLERLAPVLNRRPHPFFSCSCQAARTSFSRSGLMPDLSFSPRSVGSVSDQVNVSRIVSVTGRNVRPALMALLTLARAKPALSPVGGTETGMSAQADTFSCSRNFASTQVKVALLFVTDLHASSRPPIES